MTPLKYRYWLQYMDNHIEAHFFTIEAIENHKGLNRKSLFEAGIKILSRDRCTGLKDKNDKEIYEGDTVAKFDFEDPYFQSKIISQHGAFGYIAESEGGEFISLAQNYHFEWVDGKSQKIKIVGHPYDNPELVETPK